MQLPFAPRLSAGLCRAVHPGPLGVYKPQGRSSSCRGGSTLPRWPQTTGMPPPTGPQPSQGSGPFPDQHVPLPHSFGGHLRGRGCPVRLLGSFTGVRRNRTSRIRTPRKGSSQGSVTRHPWEAGKDRGKRASHRARAPLLQLWDLRPGSRTWGGGCPAGPSQSTVWPQAPPAPQVLEAVPRLGQLLRPVQGVWAPKGTSTW